MRRLFQLAIWSAILFKAAEPRATGVAAPMEEPHVTAEPNEEPYVTAEPIEEPYVTAKPTEEPRVIAEYNNTTAKDFPTTTGWSIF